MKIFNLPDLGEGLADAEIRAWHVQIGKVVKRDDPLVSVETAKAIVEVPSPFSGQIKQLYGKPGDVIKTGAPLVEFAVEQELKDAGSVVGSLEQSSQYLDESHVIIGSASATQKNIKAMPTVRALAKQLQVALDAVQATGAQGQITAEDVIRAADNLNNRDSLYTPLQGVRRVMALTMEQSKQHVVPVTIFDDADVTDLPLGSDITVRLMQAIIAGVEAEPSLNAWFDTATNSKKLFQDINLGLAMDTPDGLFVPVIKNIKTKTSESLRVAINTYKAAVQNRSVLAQDLQGATITLSNFGMFSGRYATPIIVPPMIAILGCGKISAAAGIVNGQIMVRRIAPLSLTFDHRAVTGGEATRFLYAVINSLAGKL